jgi:hypothetical protein
MSNDDTIDAVPAGEQHGDSSLAVVSRETGVMALATMGEQDFEQRLTALKVGQDRVRRIQRELMIGPTPEQPEGEDYGVIPGTKKPTLLKPGAEKLCNVYGLVPTFAVTVTQGDGETAPHLRVRAKCHLHRGTAEGPVVGEGEGAANSWERKHRYRGGLRSCPACGVEGAINRSRFERNGDKGWYCATTRGGCGEEFRSDDPGIADQHPGQVDNPDPYDVENTLVKMAEKRAHIDATLRATATSGLFTQDVEDIAPGGGDAPAPPPATPASSVGTYAAGTSVAPPAPGAPAAAPPAARRAPAARAASRPAAAPPARGPAKAAGGGRKPAKCPQCGKGGAIIQNRKNPEKGAWYCWPNATREQGCGYAWGADDQAIHDEAAQRRAAGAGMGASGGTPAADDPFGDSLDGPDREPGLEG